VSNEQSGYPGAPPGWYPDPAGTPGQRWWDGYAWSDSVAAPLTPLPPPPPPPAWTVASARLATSTSSALLDAEHAMVPIARVAVAIPAIHYFVDLLIQQANARQFHSLGNQFRTMYRDIQHNRPTPTFHASLPLAGVSDLFLLITVIGVIVACVWQHRAASAARGLGLPATHSPAWGVGSWFVPVVNLWMPYQAIRDCLPAADPHRRLVLRWWLILTGAWTTALAAQIAIYFSQGVALVFAVPCALFSLALLATAPRLVTAIAAAHQALRQGAPGQAVVGTT
jgi:hypothetical protein